MRANNTEEYCNDAGDTMDGHVPEKLLKVGEVARCLNMSRSGIYGLMETGRLSYVKIGKSRRVPLEAVKRLVAQNTVAATA